MEKILCNSLKTSVTKTVAILGLMLAGSFGTAANAAIVSVDFSGNDCAGVFNPPGTHGFNACNIWLGSDDEITTFAPVIAKIGGAGYAEVNSAFDSVDGSEFSITEATGTGAWSYTPGNDDPVVQFWTAKGGHGFTLFWDIDDADFLSNGGSCDADQLFSVACLAAANTVTSGEFSTPFNHHSGKHFGRSHITFYGNQAAVVPLPASLWLFMSGLLGLIAVVKTRS
jgi:hypothetical protein